MHEQQEALLARQPRNHNTEQTQELMQERQVQPRLRVDWRALTTPHTAAGAKAPASGGLEEESAVGIERGRFGRADDDLGGCFFVRDVDQSRAWATPARIRIQFLELKVQVSLPSFSWIAEFRRTRTRPRPSSAFLRRRRSQRPPRTAQRAVAARMRRDLGEARRSFRYCWSRDESAGRRVDWLAMAWGRGEVELAGGESHEPSIGRELGPAGRWIG